MSAKMWTLSARRLLNFDEDAKMDLLKLTEANRQKLKPKIIKITAKISNKLAKRLQRFS